MYSHENTDTLVEESTVSDEDEDDAAVQSQVSDMSPLLSERPETATTFEHDVPVFRESKQMLMRLTT